MEALMEAEGEGEGEGERGRGRGGIDWGGGEPRRTGCSHYHLEEEEEDALIDRSKWEESVIDQMIPWPIPETLGDLPSKAEFPFTFSSAEEYMKCLRSAISQDVIEQLHVPLGCLDQANFHEIIDIKEIDFPYHMIDVELNAAGGFRNHLRRPFRRGDMILLSEAPGKSHGISLAIVAEDEDLHFHTTFKVRIMKKSDVATSSHYKCATDLDLNIQSAIDSWLSAHADIHNKSQCIVNSIIQLPDVVADRCPNCNNSFDTSRFENDLDEYQIEAMESIVSSLSCKHFEHNIELIKGPQDSGKTKLLSAILASIGHTLRCVVYAPSASDVLGILNEIKHLNMSHNQYKQFCEKAIVFERTCDLGADFGHMSVESRIDSARKFLGTPGWKYFINWTVQVLQDYKQLYKAFTKAREASFLDIFKDEFMKASKQLKNCIQYLHTRVRDSTVEDNIMKLMSSLEEMEELLGHADLDNRCLRDVLSKKNFDASSGNYAIAEKVNNRRILCIDLLQTLKERLVSVGLRTFETRSDVEDYCINTATVMFCSADNSFYLREKVHSQIDCLIIDNANLLDENETITPLCLPALTSIFLAGDETANSQEWQQDRVGPSLFERLTYLGFKEHLLLEQHKHQSLSWHDGRKAPEQPKPPREFTWVGRPVNTKHVLAPVRNQGNKETCALHSTMATTESLYKYYYASQNPPDNFNIILDVKDMLKKYKKECGYEFGEEPKGKRLRGLQRVGTALEVLKNHGVIGTYESDKHGKVERSLPIRISSFNILKQDDMVEVSRHLIDGRFLVAAMKMSYNFFEIGSGDIYHFDPQRPIINSKSGREWLHAIMILGYGEPSGEVLMEDKHNTGLTAVQTKQPEQADIIGHLVYQNSHGKLFGFSGGYGRVGWESIVCLWLVSENS